MTTHELTQRIEELEEEVAELKRAIGVNCERNGLRKLGLTEQEAGIVGVLLTRDIATNTQIMIGANPDDLERRYSMTAQTVKVPLWNALAKLKPLGVRIENIHSRGYLMPAESKAKLMAAIANA